MNSKQLVKLSNIIGLISIILLIYWVFTFITIEVFGLKLFRKNMSETFYMSIIGILALMVGAVIINIMFNLTRIAEKHNIDELSSKRNKKIGWMLLISFPILLLILFGGNYLNSKKKEELLVNSAKSIIKINTKKNYHILTYKFDEKWIAETAQILNLLSQTDENFRNISIIVKDSINNTPVFLEFNDNFIGSLNDTISPLKTRFIRTTNNSEREYLDKVFKNGYQEYRYEANDGSYELFYPYFNGSKRIVIYFSEYQRYGKYGS